jgi:hypothetical protein
MTKTTNSKETVFQQLAQVADRVRAGTETNDDIILMMRHPHLAGLIVRHKAPKK